MTEGQKSVHKTVLLKETIDGLNLKPGSSVLDCTLGGGGHSAEICRRDRQAKIIALDQDEGAIRRAKERLKEFDCDITFIKANFRDLDHLTNFDFSRNPVDAIVFDLGLSSDQLEDSGRGFSFTRDEPLGMTMKENPRPEDITALDIVNDWEEKSLADIIYGYGEERYSKRIAKVIIAAREERKIKTTFDLVKIIENAVPSAYRRGKPHFATRTFQALRIAVNDELNALEEGLAKGFHALGPKGRIAVISFHSLEDRIVKRFFVERAKGGEGKMINKKPILPDEKEVKENPRSRSAKLRILEKIK